MVSIDGYPLDLTESEEHSLESEVTSHPVESGSDISDNVRLKPRELTLSGCIVSDTPIGTIATDPSRQLSGTSPPPSQDAYRRLEQIWTNRLPVTVVTGLKKYDNMILETLTIPREHKDAGALVFTAHFIEVRIVQNKRVTVKFPNTDKEQNLGLSLDHLIDGQKILWRHGKPPGLSPATSPAGVITLQETVTMKQTKGHTKFLHEIGTMAELTNAEFADFKKDMDRDTSLMQDRALFRANQSLDNSGRVIDRANKMADYKLAHPGENPEPSQFGLKKDPNGHYTAI